MRTIPQGFTLIELMIVLAIIGILASIVLPAYNQLLVRSANGACLQEARAYIATGTLLALTEGQPPQTFVGSACAEMIPNPLTELTLVSFIPNTPGNTNIVCDLTTDSVCRLVSHEPDA